MSQVPFGAAPSDPTRIGPSSSTSPTRTCIFPSSRSRISRASRPRDPSATPPRNSTGASARSSRRCKRAACARTPWSYSPATTARGSTAARRGCGAVRWRNTPTGPEARPDDSPAPGFPIAVRFADRPGRVLQRRRPPSRREQTLARFHRTVGAGLLRQPTRLEVARSGALEVNRQIVWGRRVDAAA